MLLTVVIKSDSFFEKRGKVIPILPHVGYHIPAEDPVVRVAVTQLVREGSEQTVTVRMCAYVTDGADTCALMDNKCAHS